MPRADADDPWEHIFPSTCYALAGWFTEGFDTLDLKRGEGIAQDVDVVRGGLGGPMRQREFVALLGSATAVRPFAARSEQVGKLPSIGYIGPNVESVDRPRVAAFAQRLGKLGWVEGRNVVIEHRATNGLAERAGEIASEFVRLKQTEKDS
jgi:hypothetical protein